MALFVVSYDLVKTKNYQVVWDALKEHGGHRITESLWLLNLNNTPFEVRDWVVSLVDSDDRVFVAETTQREVVYTNAMSGTNEWFKNNSSAA